MSLLLVIVIPVIGLAIFIVMRRAIPLFRAMQTKLDRLNLVLRESLTGIRVIRSFNRESYEQGRFDVASRDVSSTALKVNRIMAVLMPLMIFIMNITTLLIVWYGGKRIDAGSMNIGNLIAFIQYASQIMFSLVMFSMMFAMVPRAATSAGRINQMLAIQPTITDNGIAASILRQQSETGGDRRGEVEFKDVTFYYPGVGTGGIMDFGDAVSFLMAGAAAVQVGTATFLDPFAIPKIIKGIAGWMDERGVSKIDDIIGTARGQDRAH